MTRVLPLLALAALVLWPATAGAGGFATVQLSSTPTGLGAGETWSVDLTVLQHGVTPLDGIEPEVRVWAKGRPDVFAAEPTGKPGVYHADVVFPAEGTWRWEIWDGFTQTHGYAPVRIGPEPADGPGAASWWLPALAGVAAGALALVLLGLVSNGRRRRHARPEPVPGL